MANGPPSFIAINHDEYAAKYIGRTTDGRQFFLTTPFEPKLGDNPGCEFVALYIFSAAGTLIEARVESFGPRASMDKAACGELRDRWLSEVGDLKFERIEVAPFLVERYGTQFGLIPRPPEKAGDSWWVELQPGNYMAFHEPWDSGEYDT